MAAGDIWRKPLKWIAEPRVLPLHRHLPAAIPSSKVDSQLLRSPAAVTGIACCGSPLEGFPLTLLRTSVVIPSRKKLFRTKGNSGRLVLNLLN